MRRKKKENGFVRLRFSIRSFVFLPSARAEQLFPLFAC
jgi:hypothetical protein